MLLIAGQAIPRGGTLTVDPIGAGDTMGFKVSAAGTNAKVPPAVPRLLAGESGRRRRSTPTASSRSTPGCWRKRLRPEGEPIAHGGRHRGRHARNRLREDAAFRAVNANG